MAQASPSALRTIAIEVRALESLAEALASGPLGAAFEAAAGIIVRAKGRVVVTGMGKSGLVGRKIAATMASTGTPAMYIHPAEASHGDLGMITASDVVLALSRSGETDELSDILNYCGRFAVPLIAMTSGAQSTLGRLADVCMTLPQVEEACPNQLTPTSSTTMQATLGDALAVALIEVRGFSAADFLVFHPKGRLGAQMLTVADLMSIGDAVPRVNRDASILQATLEMTQKRFGITAVVGPDDHLVGAFTDGDLRRSVTVAGVEAPVRDHMSTRPFALQRDRLGSEALSLMNMHNIMQLFVCEKDRLVGVLHLHDILRAGVV